LRELNRGNAITIEHEGTPVHLVPGWELDVRKTGRNAFGVFIGGRVTKRVGNRVELEGARRRNAMYEIYPKGGGFDSITGMRLETILKTRLVRDRRLPNPTTRSPIS
jgi:hypothetical protein